MLLRNQSISYFNVKRTIWLKRYQNVNHIVSAQGSAVDQKSKGRRFEFCARSIFRNDYFLQPLFSRLYVVAVLVILSQIVRLILKSGYNCCGSVDLFSRLQD